MSAPAFAAARGGVHTGSVAGSQDLSKKKNKIISLSAFRCGQFVKNCFRQIIPDELRGRGLKPWF